VTFRERLLARDFLLGTFLNTGSPVAAEICAGAGFDWVLADLEHGSATEADLLPVLQAVSITGVTPLVRVEANEAPRFTKALDFGAEGIMVPHVESADDARRAVAHLRYAPAGVRGVALMNRSAGYGAHGRTAIDEGNERVVGIVQIESPGGVERVDEIAAADGVDCVFVGPADLTHSLGIFLEFEHPRYVAAVDAVRAAAERAGKALGVLVRSSEELARYHGLGFTFVAFGSDTSFLAAGAGAAVMAAHPR
jgi:2-keto-3-deoxy-L-rhamnonate aldolase RhmA